MPSYSNIFEILETFFPTIPSETILDYCKRCISCDQSVNTKDCSIGNCVVDLDDEILTDQISPLCSDCAEKCAHCDGLACFECWDTEYGHEREYPAHTYNERAHPRDDRYERVHLDFVCKTCEAKFISDVSAG